MITKWADFVGALGETEQSGGVAALLSNIGETPLISESPNDFNDPQGKTRYYKFIKSGVEIGFRADRLNHFHFYIQPHEGYASYHGELLNNIEPDWDEAAVVHNLGQPSRRGGSTEDALIGHVHQWLKYELQLCAVRMEFSEDDRRLWKISLMRK